MPKRIVPFQKSLVILSSAAKKKLFQMSIYINLTADSLSELDSITKIFETELSARLFYIKNARYQQPEALQSVLPRGENILDKSAT